MRFVPEERTHESLKREIKISEIKISVRCDATKKGSPDNLKQISLPQLVHLGGNGEMFAMNRYKLQTAIFDYKGWNGPEWFEKRMSTLTQTFMETAMFNMSQTMQKKARKEFLDFYKESCTNPRERPSEEDEARLLKNDYDFLPWLKQEKVLFKLDYLDTASLEADAALKQAYHHAIDDYENGVFYYCGQMLWTESTKTFHQHHKYFMGDIVKPFNMNIVEYTTRMNEYTELLQYLPPPSRKGGNSIDADWEKLTSLKDYEIHGAIYDGLPKAYQSHIQNQYDEDWTNMDVQKLLDAMRLYKNIDNDKRKVAEASKEKDNKRREDAPNRKSHGKRTMDDDVNHIIEIAMDTAANTTIGEAREILVPIAVN